MAVDGLNFASYRVPCRLVLIRRHFSPINAPLHHDRYCVGTQRVNSMHCPIIPLAPPLPNLPPVRQISRIAHREITVVVVRSVSEICMACSSRCHFICSSVDYYYTGQYYQISIWRPCASVLIHKLETLLRVVVTNITIRVRRRQPLTMQN